MNLSHAEVLVTHRARSVKSIRCAFAYFFDTNGQKEDCGGQVIVEQELNEIDSGEHSDAEKWKMMKGKVDGLLYSLGSSPESVAEINSIFQNIQANK